MKFLLILMYLLNLGAMLIFGFLFLMSLTMLHSHEPTWLPVDPYLTGLVLLILIKTFISLTHKLNHRK